MLPRWALALVGALLALAAWFAWRDHRASGEREAALRDLSAMQARFDGAVAQLVAASRTVAARVDTVRIETTHWRTLSSRQGTPPVVTDTTSRPQLVTWVDSLAKANGALRLQGDQLERACTALANDCERLRLKADSVPDLVRQLREATERAVKAEPPRRRWSPFGCSGGYGATASGGQLRTGIGVACGASYSL